MKTLKKTITGLALTAMLCFAPLAQADSWWANLKTYFTTMHDRENPKPPFKHKDGYWTDQLGKNSEAKTERENKYDTSHYIAEWWCTLSNLPFLYVAYQHNAPEVALAGAASMAFHGTTKEKALHLDRICAVTAAVGVGIRSYIKSGGFTQELLWIAPTALAIAAADDIIANTAPKDSWAFKLTPLWHSIWHCSAAYFAHRLLSK